MKWSPGRGCRVKIKRVLALAPLLLCVLMLMPNRALAACSYGAAQAAEVLNVTMPANVTIPRDAPLGTVIAIGTITSAALGGTTPTWGVYCDSASTYSYTNMMPGGNTVSNAIWPTGMAGIGYQLMGNTGTAVSTASGSLPASYFNTGSGTGCPTQATGQKCYVTFAGPLGKTTVKFINTGPLTGSYTIPAGDVMQVWIGGMLATDVRLANSIQVLGQTCAVTTPSIPVTLGNIKSSVFTATGTKSPAVPFTIGLNCTGVATNVGITFTDNTNTGNTTNILSLTPSTALPNATGVGIQIVQQSNGTAVKYGPDSAVAGNVNQIMLGASNSSVQSYTFSGQYISTASKVTGGPANGVATFTMSYQ